MHTYRFGTCEVCPAERKLLVDGKAATLGSRAFDVLVVLIERRDRVVGKNELFDTVWPDVVVEENNLQVHISALRKLIGHPALTTVPGRGYQFTAAIEGQPSVPRPSPPLSEAASKSNLPAAAEALIGRDADVELLRTLIAANRLVTVLGAGGIGKTRVSQELARSLVEAFDHGVWWVDLAVLSSPDLIASAIAAAAGVKLGTGDALAGLALGLSRRRVLLVLDNCEHLVEPVARLARSLLDAVPGLRILATSQAAFQLQSEVLFRLQTLAVPAPGVAYEAARGYGALQLLERRAQSVDRRFRLVESNFAAAAELCRHLDGIALAIEMAAARLPTMGLEALNLRLGERLRLLRSASRDAAPRHHTMHATLAWSHSMLDAREQSVLRRLSSFVGSFRLEPAQLVSASSDIDAWDALDILGALADKSLLQVQPGEIPRYRLLETTRLFALERLAESAEYEDVMSRHGRAMAVLAAEIVSAYQGERDDLCTRRYVADYDDLAAAFERARDRRDATVAAAAAEALTAIDFGRGYYSLMRGRKVDAYRLLEGAGPVERAQLWHCIAFGRYIPCPQVTKQEAARQEVEAWRAVGARHRLYEALGRQSMIESTAGNFDAGEKALLLGRDLEDPSWSPNFRLLFAFNVGMGAAYGIDVDVFERRTREMLALAEETRSARYLSIADMWLTEVLLNKGRYREALEFSRKAMARWRALNNPHGIGNGLSTYCSLLIATDHLDLVVPAADEALTYVFLSNIAGWLFDPLSLYAARTGRHAQAATLLGYADAKYQAIDEIRRIQDNRNASQSTALVGKAIGGASLAELRASGARLSDEGAIGLAREILGIHNDSGPLSTAAPLKGESGLQQHRKPETLQRS